MRAIVLFFLISGMLSACGGSNSDDKKSADKLQVISSIKPIQAIVVAITGEYAQSQQLIPDYASPHNYSFKPSDIRKVKNADVVFRIDKHMESELNALFDNLDGKQTVVSLAEIKAMKLLEASDAHHDDPENKEEGEHDNLDFHIWTSPKNAILIAKSVTDTLSQLDSKNAKNYQQNLAVFTAKLKQESAKISSSLNQYKKVNYLVFHNSWQYFADEYGLQKPIVIDQFEEVSSGAKKVIEIRSKIESENIKCVFYDNSISDARLKLLTGSMYNTKIDVLGTEVAIDQSAYIKWLKRMATQLESCLSK